MTYVDSDPANRHNADDPAPEQQELTFDELYTKFFPKLVKQARGHGVRDPEATAQEVFIKAYEHFGREGTMHPGWLYKVLRNAMIDESRMAKRRNTVLESELRDSETRAFEDRLDPTAEDSFESVEFDDTMEHVGRVITPRSPKWNHILARRALRGDSYAEISEDLGVSMGTVRSGLHRAKEVLADDPEIRELAGKK